MSQSQEDNSKDAEKAGPQDGSGVKLSHFGPARIAVVAFEKNGAGMPPKIVVSDPSTRKFYCLAQMADSAELPEDEAKAIQDFLDMHARQAQMAMSSVMNLPIGPDGQPVLPAGMTIGPNGMIVPK